jgi:hypothetical protein
MGWQSFLAAGLAGAVSVAAFALDPAGSEFRVNTYTAGDQAYPAACADRQGGAVVVWESADQDGSGNAVRAQRYDGDGAPLGGELEVNSFTTGSQQLPSVTCGGPEGFVVVWESRNQDGDDYGVVGRMFDGAGAPSGGEFAVNTATADRQNAAATCSDADGNFVVVWQSYDQDGDGYGIFGQRFDAAGGRRGSEFQVNSFTEYSQEEPDVACAADGGFVVVWQGGAQDGDGYGIFGQRFDGDAAKAGSEFVINSYTSGTQQLPAVASAADGDFVVVWESYDDQDGDGYGIFGRRFSAAGVPSGSEFRVNASTAHSQQKPAVSAGPAGDFTVAWSSPDDDGYGVFARTFDATGTPAGTAEFRVNSYTLGDQGAVSDQGHVLSVANAADGTFLIAWQSLGVTVPEQDGSGAGVYAQRYVSPSTCPGDCDQSGLVQINELVTGVGIALGTTPLEDCRAFDRDANGSVDVAELIAAVNAALNGCP